MGYTVNSGKSWSWLPRLRSWSWLPRLRSWSWRFQESPVQLRQLEAPLGWPGLSQLEAAWPAFQLLEPWPGRSQLLEPWPGRSQLLEAWPGRSCQLLEAWPGRSCQLLEAWPGRSQLPLPGRSLPLPGRSQLLEACGGCQLVWAQLAVCSGRGQLLVGWGGLFTLPPQSRPRSLEVPRTHCHQSSWLCCDCSLPLPLPLPSPPLPLPPPPPLLPSWPLLRSQTHRQPMVPKEDRSIVWGSRTFFKRAWTKKTESTQIWPVLTFSCGLCNCPKFVGKNQQSKSCKMRPGSRFDFCSKRSVLDFVKFKNWHRRPTGGIALKLPDYWWRLFAGGSEDSAARPGSSLVNFLAIFKWFRKSAITA